MSYSTTNASGTSSVAPGVGHFLLFPAPHVGGFVAFCMQFVAFCTRLIPTYILGWGGSVFTLTGALIPDMSKNRKDIKLIIQQYFYLLFLQTSCLYPSSSFLHIHVENRIILKCSWFDL